MKLKDSGSGETSEQPDQSSASSRAKPSKSDSGPLAEVSGQRTEVSRKKKSVPPAIAGRSAASPKTGYLITNKRGKKKRAGGTPPVPGKTASAHQSKTPPTDASAAATTADTQHSELSTQNSAATGPNGYELYSISKLAELFEMDRSVVRRRLQAAKIKPVDKKEKRTIYELTPEVEELLGESGDPRLDDVRLEDAQITKETKRVKLEKLREQAISKEEVFERLIPIFKGLHDRFLYTYAPAAGAELRKLKTGRQITAQLKRDFTKIFSELREDYRTFLK